MTRAEHELMFLGRQYRKHRPTAEQLEDNRGRALLTFAGRSILADIRERNRRWTWAYFAERRDDRNAYVDFFKKQMLNQLAGNVSLKFQDCIMWRSLIPVAMSSRT